MSDTVQIIMILCVTVTIGKVLDALKAWWKM